MIFYIVFLVNATNTAFSEAFHRSKEVIIKSTENIIKL